MIKFADSQTAGSIRQMWEVCFDDVPEFVDLYFSEKYKNENTLVYFDKDKAIASLQMLPYQFTFCGVEIPIAYISGACTLPEYRGRGIMRELLLTSFHIMHQRQTPLSILVPAEEWLYAYYANYDYQTVFESDKTCISLEHIIDSANGNIDTAYNNLDVLYRNKDFCVQKTREDFSTIVKDAELYGFPLKTNIAGMARVVDAKCLLELFAEKYPEKSFTLSLQDKFLQHNDNIFSISNGKCRQESGNKNIDFSVNVNVFCQLLFGFHLEQLPLLLTQYFISHRPVMNLMLE